VPDVYKKVMSHIRSEYSVALVDLCGTLIWCGLLICGIEISSCIVGCSESAPAEPVTPATTVGSGHLVIRPGYLGPWSDEYSPALEASSISLSLGEHVSIKQFYFPPPPPRPIEAGAIGLGAPHNTGQTCSSCRATNPAVARIKYLPAAGCYAPPDYLGENPMPCGIPADVYVEGNQEGQTTISTTAVEDGKPIDASTKIQVGKDGTRIAVTSPRWGAKFRQGGKNLISWHCPECSSSDHMILEVYSGEQSSQGVIANLQPRNGSYIWDAKTVCMKELAQSPLQCYDLRPGYYWLMVSVEVDRTYLNHAPTASSGPFQILAQHPAHADDVTGDMVRGFIVTGDPFDGNFFWVQTADAGKRLVCFSPTTPLNISPQSHSTALSMTARELPFGTRIEAKGTWENAHSIACTGTGTDPDAPPRLRTSEVRLAGSGLFGTYKKCRVTGISKACRDVDYMPVEISDADRGAQTEAHANQRYGQYLAPMTPGHYFVFDQPVEVKPGHWTRLDIELPE
jgi:hypothetical protein